MRSTTWYVTMIRAMLVTVAILMTVTFALSQAVGPADSLTRLAGSMAIAAGAVATALTIAMVSERVRFGRHL